MNKPLSVLLADDDTADHERMKRALLSVSGTRVSSMFNGMELVDHLVAIASGGPGSNKLPDLVITDLYMPFAGGLQVLKKLRAHQSLKKIPVYVFSRNFDKTIQSRVIENGASDFFVKPANEKELLFLVKEILSRSWQSEIRA